MAINHTHFLRTLYLIGLFMLVLHMLSGTPPAHGGQQTDPPWQRCLNEKNPLRANCFRDASQLRSAVHYCEQFLDDPAISPQRLQQLAYLHYRLGWLYASEDEKKDHYLQYFHYAKLASQAQPDNYQSAVLLAGAKAKLAGYLAAGDKVRLARELNQELKKLLAREKNDPDTLYILSWLNFKVGRVSHLQKLLASLLFGGLPEGLSVDRGFESLQKAIQLRPQYIVYQFDLGLYYQLTGDTIRATVQFNKVRSMQPESSEGVLYQRKLSYPLRTKKI